MLPLLVTTNAATPAFNTVALGCRYISPSSTVTARTACGATCVGDCVGAEAGAAAAVFVSNAVRSSRLSSNSVDATSTKVTTIVMAMVLNNVSCDGLVDFTNLSFTQSRGGKPTLSCDSRCASCVLPTANEAPHASHRPLDLAHHAEPDVRSAPGSLRAG